MWVPTESDSPFTRLGGRDAVVRLAETFYDVMEEGEPGLAKLHPLTAEGHIDRGARERFALFLVGWLGGPQDYVAAHGHPRLRMRHGRVLVDLAMRDAWLRCMGRAMDAHGVTGEVREFLDARFAQVADFMRNTEG
ncbi:MAG: group II truncated hemoglobin [Myxococcales bacterium]|nr:group II truncated hemoglobin [Myxococcales bacterium]